MAGELLGLSRRHLIVSGHVQGVGYRMSCARRCRKLGIAGWVRNLQDGSVEIVMEGPRDAVAEVERWCKHGPELARVTSIDATDEPPTLDVGFSIK
jgi:acylphosphatase